jgi:hypothetical protein
MSQSAEHHLSRTTDGALIVREGLPEKWHYTITLDDSRPDLAATVTVMFDGVLRCQLRMTRLGRNEDSAVKASRIKVLEWVGDYLHRHGTPGI